jgi:hypothetical protein
VRRPDTSDPNEARPKAATMAVTMQAIEGAKRIKQIMQRGITACNNKNVARRNNDAGEETSHVLARRNNMQKHHGQRRRHKTADIIGRNQDQDHLVNITSTEDSGE